MIALSIRQPWAWLILNGAKDIENRDWKTNFRGRVLLHVGKVMTRSEYEDGLNHLLFYGGPQIDLPPMDQLVRGGVVGAVDIVDCVEHSESPWFFGPFGFVLRNPTPMPFMPWKGKLGFFNVPESEWPC